MTVQRAGLQALLSGVYTSLPLLADAVEVERGMAAFAGDSWPTPSMFKCVINNDTLDYDPSRPAALLYGIAGRNTRVRIAFGPSLNNYLYAEATTWRPSRTPDHVPGARRGRAQTELTANGLLNRLQLWTEALKSPMFRTISARSSSIAHWPGEEDRNASVLSNTLSGGQAGQAKGVTFGNDDAPLGAARSIQMAEGGSLSGRFKTASTTAGWQVSWSFRFPEIPSSGTYELMFRINVSNGYTWFFDINSGSYRMNVTDADGVLLTSQNYTFGTGAEPNKWITMRIVAEQSGSNINCNWGWYAQDLDDWYVGTTPAFAGQVGVARDWRIPGTVTTAGSYWCHIFGVTGVADNLMSATARSVFNGYKGELAETRYNRLMSENGLNRYTIGIGTQTQAMGPQLNATLLDNLKIIRRTEDADLSDERFDIGTTIRTRRAMYHMTPALALTYPDHIADYVKLVGAEGAWNQVTVKNNDGGEYTLTQTTGPMSVSPPPAGIGEVRKQIDVSVDDERAQLPLLAQWHLAKGVLDGPRYTEVTVDLARHTSLLTAARAVREGDLITVTGIEPDLLRLLVVGIRRRVVGPTDRITFLTEPYDTYMVGVWDGFKWGTDLSSLASSAGPSATSLSLTTASRKGRWDTGFTGDLIIAGERVTVTAMGAPSGSGPYTQTATVVRAVNGVSKTLPAGSKVKLFDQRKWGL